MHLKGILKAMKANGTTTEKSPRPVMRTATWLNVCWGILEASVGGVTDSSSAFSGGVHSISDGASHAMHTATHIQESSKEYTEKKVQNRRKWAAGAIAVGALLTGAHSINALTNPVANETINVQALSVEMGVVAINASLIYALTKRKDDSVAYTDAFRHFLTDGAIGIVTSASIALTPTFEYADGIGGLIATGASTWLAYKTAKPHSHEHAIESVV